MTMLAGEWLRRVMCRICSDTIFQVQSFEVLLMFIQVFGPSICEATVHLKRHVLTDQVLPVDVAYQEQIICI